MLLHSSIVSKELALVVYLPHLIRLRVTKNQQSVVLSLLIVVIAIDSLHLMIRVHFQLGLSA